MKKIITILLAICALMAFSGCIQDNSLPDETEKIYCTQELKEADMCTMEYNPVCGDNGETYANPCVACSSGEINYYISGEC